MGLDQIVVASRRVVGWLQGLSSPWMAVRAERIMVLAAVVIRVTFLVQVGLSMLPEGPRAVRPVLFYCLSTVLIVESLLVVVYMLRLGRYVPVVAMLDAGAVAILIVVQPYAIHVGDVVGTWVSWGYAAAIAVAVPTAIGVKSWRIVLGCAAFLGGAYVAGCLLHPISGNAEVTALTNVISVVGMSVACRLGGGFVRAMGIEADRAREVERMLLHNYAPVLYTLSKDIADPSLRESVMDAAARGAQEIRAVLADSPQLQQRNHAGQRYLRAVVDGVCAEFTDLPLVRNLELLGDVVLNAYEAGVVEQAVRTVLWNVRRHARASTVTVHGDCRGSDDWTVTVSDDGVGFDQAVVSYGFGLSVQAGESVTRAGMEISVESEPGEGTRVELRPVAAADRLRRG